MGAYLSEFESPPHLTVLKFAKPANPNWITGHALATKLSVIEVERLWYRFQQLGCNLDGNLDTTALAALHKQNAITKLILEALVDKKSGLLTFQRFLLAIKWFRSSHTPLKERLSATFLLFSNGNDTITKDQFIDEFLSLTYPHEIRPALCAIATLFFNTLVSAGAEVLTLKNFLDFCDTRPYEEVAFCMEYAILPPDLRATVLSAMKNTQGMVDLFSLPLSKREDIIRATLNPRGQSVSAPFPDSKDSKKDKNKTQTDETVWPLNDKFEEQLMRSSFSSDYKEVYPYPADDLVPGDKLLEQLAEKMVARDWEVLGNQLSFLSDDMNAFKRSQPRSTKAQIYSMLLRWKSRDGRNATARLLQRALARANLGDLALLLQA